VSWRRPLVTAFSAEVRFLAQASQFRFRRVRSGSGTSFIPGNLLGLSPVLSLHQCSTLIFSQ